MAAAAAGAGDAPKSSVRKPVALKYRSGGGGGGGGGGASPRGGGRAPAPAPAPAAANGGGVVSGAATPEATAAAAAMEATAPERGASGRAAARGFLLCYLCGRAFGRASLPLHEPHCLQRWQRENDALPPSLRRQPPERPAGPAAVVSPDQWNRMAWEASQLRLVPCSRCGRTFAPDRLPVHERSCKAAPVANTAAASTAACTTAMAPAATATSSEQRGSGDGGGVACVAGSRPPGSVPCEWCGRLFGSASIAIHAPQCAARPAPADGSMDMEGTMDAIWQSHLEQLVPCVHCGRTFYPDRLEVHQRACKGPRR